MADTLQAVSWHLEFACPFRRGDAVTAFLAAWKATEELKHIDHCEATRDIYGDICVTGEMYFRGDRSPYSGFRISAAVAPVGDLPAARATCGTCPANALKP